jgi:hypothetical protein
MAARQVPPLPAQTVPEFVNATMTDTWRKFWIGLLIYVSGAPNGTNLAVSTSYANDSAAAAGGVPIGGWYRNGSVLQLRIT